MKAVGSRVTWENGKGWREEGGQDRSRQCRLGGVRMCLHQARSSTEIGIAHTFS